jgi:uncharacterized protein
MVVKPSDKEQEYFIAKEVKRLKKLQEENARTMAEEERRKLKELHYMHCTKCGQKMETTTLAEVEIEICPGCGGVYLDAGELNKIVSEQTGSFTKALGIARKLWTAS